MVHRTREYVVTCADPNCDNRVTTTSHRKEKLCPSCEEIHRQQSTQRSRKRAKESTCDTFDPDLWLEKKLDGAEYCIQHDAAPEEESFPADAKVTKLELDILLENCYLQPGSVVRRCKDQVAFIVNECQKTGRCRLNKLVGPPRP